MNRHKKIRLAQIGVGYWGPNLLRNFDSNKRCEVVCVADRAEERRQFVNNLYPHVETTEDGQAVLERDDIDAVVVATPAETHYSIVCEALERNKHVLVEKPMATTVGEVDRIKDLAERKGLTAMVGHTFIFNAAVRYLKELIDSGELGDIRYVYSQRLNLGRIRSDVDALWNLAPHDVSILQYLLDDPKPLSISRKGMDFIQNGIDDVVFLNIEYENKVLGHVHVSWLDPHKVRKTTVVGSKKMVVYDDISENKIEIYDKGIEPKAVLGEHMDYDKAVPEFIYRKGDVYLPAIQWQEPLKLEIDHFIDCVFGLDRCQTGPDHAKEVVRILADAEIR